MKDLDLDNVCVTETTTEERMTKRGRQRVTPPLKTLINALPPLIARTIATPALTRETGTVTVATTETQETEGRETGTENAIYLRKRKSDPRLQTGPMSLMSKLCFFLVLFSGNENARWFEHYFLSPKVAVFSPCRISRVELTVNIT